MAETSKAHARHERDGYFAKYFVGHGVDIGAGDDPITPTCDIRYPQLEFEVTSAATQPIGLFRAILKTDRV